MDQSNTTIMDALNANSDAMMLDHTNRYEDQQHVIYPNNMNIDNIASSSETWGGSTDYIDPALLDPTTFGHGAALRRDEGMEDAPFELDDASNVRIQNEVENAENDFLSTGPYASPTAHTHQPILHHQQYDAIQTQTPTRRLGRLNTTMLPTPPMSQPSQHRLNAEAFTFEPGMDWQGNLQRQPHHHDQESRNANMGRLEVDLYEGYLTPTSAASAQNRRQSYYTAFDSPTPESQQASQHQNADPRYSILSVEATAPALNFNGAEAGIAAVHNMQGWVQDGPYIPNAMGTIPSRDHLHSAEVAQPRKKRSASQASFTCTQDDCPKTFATKADRDHHERYHGNRDHACGVCGKGFHFPKDLKRHTKIHNPRDRHLMCTILHCKYHTRGFHRQDHLDRHLNKVHGIQSARNSTRGNTPA